MGLHAHSISGGGGSIGRDVFAARGGGGGGGRGRCRWRDELIKVGDGAVAGCHKGREVRLVGSWLMVVVVVVVRERRRNKK